MRITGIFALLALAIAAFAAATSMFEGQPAILIGNDKIQIVVLPQGAAIASIARRDDTTNLTPLWNPARMARETGQKNTFNGVTGHFLCVDGFGGVSPEERAAGLPGHGEAHERVFGHESSYTNGEAVHQFTTELPITREKVQRTMLLRDGESVMQVDTEIESLLGFDRPIFWAEHATIGSPFLEAGVTVVDMSAKRAKTRPYAPEKSGLPHRLPSDKEFTWPMAPGLNGKMIDLRAAPTAPNSGDHTTSLMDTSRPTAFVTMLNPRRRMMLGYVFRPGDYAWTQNWEFYPSTGKLARGLEFSTLPFDLPRRQVTDENTMFGTRLYRWLPAKSKITSRFLMFYTPTPAGMRKVDKVWIENGAIFIEDATTKLVVRLPTKSTL